jgi:hypothetical protein
MANKERLRQACSGIFACLLGLTAAILTAPHAVGDIAIRRDSRPIVLGGYSMDLEKQAIDERLQTLLATLLPALKRDLEHLFKVNVGYLSERSLVPRLQSKQLGRSPAAIKEFLEKEGYTHLIVAKVDMIDEEDGQLVMQIAEIKRLLEQHDDGTLGKAQEQRLRENQSNPEIDAIRKSILQDFARFRESTLPKTVHIDCILPPQNPILRNLTEPLQLERELSPRITRQLIKFHRSDQMKKWGYWTDLADDAYEFQPSNTNNLTCKRRSAQATNVTIRISDYTIRGEVAVQTRNTIGQGELKINIDIIRHLPPPCDHTIPISDTFDPAEYHRQTEFSERYSQKDLLRHYEAKWMQHISTCTKDQ